MMQRPGCGHHRQAPVVVQSADGSEAIGVRSMVYLALSYDHRLVDGADASRYLMDVKRRLEAGDFTADLTLILHADPLGGWRHYWRQPPKFFVLPPSPTATPKTRQLPHWPL